MYSRLQHLWGSHVPRFLGFGATCAGSIWFLATLHYDATSWAYCAMTPKRKQSAVAALQAVHEAGVLHGDIRLDYFIAQRRGAHHLRYQVFILDFGFSNFSTDRSLLLKEHEKLLKIL